MGVKRKAPKARKARLFPEAELLVAWLNAVRDTPAYDEFLSVLAQVHEFRAATVRIQDARKLAQKDTARSLDYRVSISEAEKLDMALHTSLARYVFRPLLSYNIIADSFSPGLAPVDQERWPKVAITSDPFYASYPGHRISEPEAVLSLTRLYVTDELKRVHLCDAYDDFHLKTCRGWHVAARSNSHFCSSKCRLIAMKNSPEFRARKVRLQTEYRERVKQKRENEDAIRIEKKEGCGGGTSQEPLKSSDEKHSARV